MNRYVEFLFKVLTLVLTLMGVVGIAPSASATLLGHFDHSYAGVDIALDLFDGQPGGRYLWRYTVTNNSFDPNPGTSNGFSGFELFLPALIPEIADVSPNPGSSPPWEVDCCSGSPVEWDRPNSDGNGVMPGDFGLFSFTTDPRQVAINDGGWFHTWEFDSQTNIITTSGMHVPWVPGLVTPPCGDGSIVPPEECDPGSVPTGCGGATPICDVATCQCKPEGPGPGQCGSAPASGCRSAGKSLLLIKNNATDDTKDKLVWKWLKGPETSLEDLGVPTGTTNYTLCLYAGTNSATVALPAGSNWQTAGSKGYKFNDPSGTPDGAQKALLKSGATGKAKALVKGKGTNLPDTLVPALPLPVTVQLVNDTNSTCFEATYNTTIKNDAKQFKAKTP